MTEIISFKDRVAVVTGAAGNIGRSVVRMLAERGVKVAATDYDRATTEAALASVVAAGGVVKCYGADVTDRAAVERVRDAVLADFGKVDILVNNAGVWENTDVKGSRRFETVPEKEWQRILAINVGGVMNFSQAFLPQFVANRYGRIVNLGSIAGEVGKCGYADYSAAKAAVIRLTQVMAMENARLGITINSISPGMVAAGPIKQTENTWVGREGAADEMARAIVFLAADESAFITGADLPVDGGRILVRAMTTSDISNVIRGPFPILSVPYEADGALDLDILEKEARFVAATGVNGFIWAQSNDAIDLLTLDERKRSFERLVRAFAGQQTIVVLGCQGQTTADMEELARCVERLADDYPATRLAIACRPPHDARTQEDIERYYRTLAGIARRPVIIQTYCSDKVPVPSSELLIRLAREYPDVYGWIKEETDGADAVVRMRRECEAPEVKTVFSAWGSYGWIDQHRNIGTRGVISERAAYADYLMEIWRALEKGDRARTDRLWAGYLLLMNLKETMPGGHLRGFNLYVLQKRGIFKNGVSREYVDERMTPGTWKVVERTFTPAEIAEIESRWTTMIDMAKG